MPYFGVRVATNDSFYVIVKFHGPLDTFIINPQELKKVVSEQMIAHFKESDNIPKLCFSLASHLKAHYLNGNELVWVDVEVFTKNNLIFGATAEKVLT